MAVDTGYWQLYHFEMWVHGRHDKLLRQSMDDLEQLDFLKKQLGEATSGDNMLIFYASKTGNAAEFAAVVAQTWSSAACAPSRCTPT